MKNAFYILIILLLLPACGDRQEENTSTAGTREQAPRQVLMPDKRIISRITKIENVLPPGWKIESIKHCDAPGEWNRISGKEGMYVRVWQEGVSFMEHCGKSGDDHEYTPTVHIYLMPRDWEGEMVVTGERLLVKDGKLMKPKVKSYMNQAVSPARFLGACKEGLLFGEIPWPEHWKSFEKDIAETFGVKLEISKEHPLCGSKLTVEKVIEETELVVHVKALNRPVGFCSESGVIAWTGKFEIISLFKGNLSGQEIQIQYVCVEAKLHEGYVDEGEEAILFLKEERGNSPYTQAAKIIWATHENLESVEKLIAEWDGR